MSIAEQVEAGVLTEHQRAWVDGLRAMADFAEAHPGVIGEYPMAVNTFHAVYDDDPWVVRRQMGERARAMAPCEKEVPDYDPEKFRLVKRFGPHKLSVFADREVVCERRVVGVEEVEVEGYNEDAQAAIDAMPKVTVTETREVVEWGPSLLGGAS